jgi:hypothetical protein
MPLKKSAADAVYATIESRRPAIRVKVAPSTGFLNQSCAAAPSKSFFNTIGHERTHAAQSEARCPPDLFDHFVGTQQDGLGNSQADRRRGLPVDDQFEFRRLLDR